MAKNIVAFLSFQFLILLLLVVKAQQSHGYARKMDKKVLGLKKEKLTHIRFYWHDIASGPKPSAVQVVKAVNASSTFFGAVFMIDDPMTEGPELSSKLVGKAQGFYAMSSQEEPGLLMAMNLAFVQGKYKGSTVTVLGRNVVTMKVREMPVIGGSGIFRFARGYVEARTYTFNTTTGDAIVQYNAYVLHY